MENLIATKFGPIQVTPTDAKHIFVTEAADCITVNNVTMHFSAHCYLWSDGYWHIGMENRTEYERRLALYTSKLSHRDHNDKQPSESARGKLAEVLTLEVNAWTKANPGALLRADIEDTEKAFRKAQEELNDALEVVERLEQRKRDLSNMLDALRLAVSNEAL